MFVLDERLSSSSFKIIDFSLSELRLKNNKNYPWIILIPRVSHVITEIFELSISEQLKLMQEIARVANMMKQYFLADKINIGALGNIVSQLHVHVIARSKKDSAWPQGVWQTQVIEAPYSEAESQQLLQELRALLL